MGLNYSLIVPPTVEPISLSLAKKQLRVDIPDDDFLIETMIGDAREWCESYTNRAFFPQTWELYLDNFPYGDYRDTVPMDQRNPWNYSAYWSDFAIRLPKPMAQQVLSINFLDANGNPRVLNSIGRVNTNGTAVTALDSFAFTAGSSWRGLPIIINDVTYTIENVTSPDTLNLTTSAGVQTDVFFHGPALYFVDFTSRPARITPPLGGMWPITQFYLPGSIQIPYVASSYSMPMTETGTPVAAQGTTEPFLYTVKNQVIDLVSVVDGNGAPVTFTDALILDANGDPTDQTQISLTAAPAGGTITVSYVGSTLPKPIRRAMLLLIGHFYEHREEVSELRMASIPLGVKSLIKRYKFDIFGDYESGY